jgi:teichuronic acid biosynthesis glycosyltransferase TuaH
MKVVLISRERWDDVGRRNQHLAVELIRLGHVSGVWFVQPPLRGLESIRMRPVGLGVVAVTPASPAPKSRGGLVQVGRLIRQRLVEGADLLWVNDPALGVQCLTPSTPAVYDVTGDWRTAGFPTRIVRRIVRAEDRLAREATTIVCSEVLKQRWKARYGIDAQVVRNAIDVEAWTSATPVALPGPGPHVGYVGTLHEQRFDVDLVIDLAGRLEIGTVHLVGPDCLSSSLSARLRRMPGLRLHGPVAAREVPGWMKAMDVLISPHLVNDFTLSQDAIKAHEYAASGRQVVATPTSGFTPVSERISVVPAAIFVNEVLLSILEPAHDLTGSWDRPGQSWSDRAKEFWSALDSPKESSRM